MSFDKNFDTIHNVKIYTVALNNNNIFGNHNDWNFPKELQDKIINEKDEDWIPIDFSILDKQDDECNSNCHTDCNNTCNNEGNGKDTPTADDGALDQLKHDLQNNVLMELKDHLLYTPYTFTLSERNKSLDSYKITPYFKCICESVKNENCVYKRCKFKYSKNLFPNEADLKDGLEIMDIPSTLLETIEKRENDNERKRRLKQKQIDEFVEQRRANRSSSSTGQQQSPQLEQIQQPQQQVQQPQQQVPNNMVNIPANAFNGQFNNPVNNAVNIPAVFANNMVGTMNMLNRMRNNLIQAFPLQRPNYNGFNVNNIVFDRGLHNNQHVPINFPVNFQPINNSMVMEEDALNQQGGINGNMTSDMNQLMNTNINDELEKIDSIGRDDDTPKRKTN